MDDVQGDFLRCTSTTFLIGNECDGESGSMKCETCGTDVLAEALFCQKCGERLRDDEDPSPQDQPRPAGENAREKFKQGAADRQGDEGEEETLWQGGYCSKAMIGTWALDCFLTVLIGGLFIYLAVSGTLAPFIAATAGVAIVLLIWLFGAGLLAIRKLDVHYMLSNQRFIHKSGILRRTTDRIEVIDMDDVTFEQGVIERMLGVGSIKITSSDRSHPELILIGIDDVQRVASLIDDVRRKERLRRGLHIEAI